jgi:hypothetical protein
MELRVSMFSLKLARIYLIVLALEHLRSICIYTLEILRFLLTCHSEGGRGKNGLPPPIIDNLQTFLVKKARYEIVTRR